jgi:hypothetical protein
MLADENPDVLPDGDAGQAVASRLAERLVSLDLPGRAGPVLEKLMNATPEGAARAEFGERLAALRLQRSDPLGALVALSASTAESLPSSLLESRTLIFASAQAQFGHLSDGLAALQTLDTPAGDNLQAALLGQAGDWQGATRALQRFVARTLPGDGTLNAEQAHTVLRLAAAAAQAGDQAALAFVQAQCQSAFKTDPASASKVDPGSGGLWR